MRTKLGLVAFGITLLAAAAARADGAGETAAAQALFDEGRRLMTEGNFAAACPKLESSQKLDPGAGTLLNLATCYEKNGQTASAWVTYQDAAAASGERHPDWAERARAGAAALAPILSRLTVTVPTKVDGLEIRRDGSVLDDATWGAPIPVDPGPHVIEASAPGKTAFRRTIDVAPGGARATIVVKLEAAGVAPGSPVGSGGSGLRIAGASIAGAGVVSLAVGAVFGFVALGRRDDAASSNDCTTDLKTCNAVGGAKVDDARSAATISTVTLALGAGLAVGGMVLFFVAPARIVVGLHVINRVESAAGNLAASRYPGWTVRRSPKTASG